MRRLLASLAASALVILPAMPAGAIVDGEPDGDVHPMVGALVAEFDGEKDWFCSGTLVSSTVFLTAGHCTDWLAEDQAIWVTFEPEFDPSGPFHPGTPVTHPSYNPRTLANDVAVVLLDTPVVSAGTPPSPPRGCSPT
ncbi:MAG TPA: trypsin-like serine protease [Actinomycetota bacterium]